VKETGGDDLRSSSSSSISSSSSGGGGGMMLIDYRKRWRDVKSKSNLSADEATA